MAAEIIGRVISQKTCKSYEVKWNRGEKNVYVTHTGWARAGKAEPAAQAIQVGEAFVYNK